LARDGADDSDERRVEDASRFSNIKSGKRYGPTVG
jgi:hypothetical protein